MELEFFTCYTLVDITQTGVLRVGSGVATKMRDQQRNWETLIQAISLRAQPVTLRSPVVVEKDLSELGFGDRYRGVHRIWKFSFAAEHEGVYTIDSLAADVNKVPCTVGLDETVALTVPIFSTVLDYANTLFICGDK